MRIIDDKRAVSKLSEVVTVEMTLGEMALLTAIIGEITPAVAESNIDDSVIKLEYKAEVKKLDESMYDIMLGHLAKEGVC